MQDAFNSLIRGVIIGLLIVIFVKVTKIELTVDAMAKAIQVEVKNNG